MNSEETVSLIAGTRSSDFLWRQTRTAFKKVIGYSPIASAHKVTQYREKVMVAKKEDWKTEDKPIY